MSDEGPIIEEEDPWWPPGSFNPAFQVQRLATGVLPGGDYVRGSSVDALYQTAIRYPTVSAKDLALAEEVKGKAFLAIRPYGHSRVSLPYPDDVTKPPFVYEIGTAEIRWGWTSTTTTLNNRNYLWSTNTAESMPPAGQVAANAALLINATNVYVNQTDADGNLVDEWNDLKVGTNFYLYENNSSQSVEFEVNAAPTDFGSWLKIPVAVRRVTDFAPEAGDEIQASFVPSGGWYEVALVRSGFGKPVTPTDGVTLFQASRKEFDSFDPNNHKVVPPPILYDTPLQPGQCYYYSLFFRTSRFDWTLGMAASVVIPKNYHHRDHLWNAIPPYYQTQDSNLREGNGPLRQFLGIFGYELDLTREYVEQWQNVYHIDKTPMSLLRRVGENFSIPYKGGVGDIRFRAMLAGLPEMLKMRGTPAALKQVIETGSKYKCDISVGSNLMLLTDDSVFTNGVGNWGVQHQGAGVGWDTMTPQNVFMDNGGNQPPNPFGIHSMRVYTTEATETSNFAISCGCAVGSNGREKNIYPLTAGIPIEPGFQYGVSLQVFAELGSAVSVTISLLWFNKTGLPVGFIGKSEKAAEATTANAWKNYFHQGVAPAGATYLVPALYFTGRSARPTAGRSWFIDVGGVIVYEVDKISEPKEYISPDKYLTLGDPEEVLGVRVVGQEETTGFILGRPKQV